MSNYAHFSRIVSLILTAGMIAAGSANAAATEFEQSTPNDAGTTCSAPTDPVKSRNTTESPEKSALIKTVKSDVMNGTITVKGGVEHLDLDNAKVTTVEDNHGQPFDFVTLPYHNEAGYNFLSNVTLGYASGSDSSPVSTFETHYTKSADNKFQITEFNNGQTVKDEELNIGYVDGATLQANLNVDVPSHDTSELQGWGEKVGCLGAILGVNGVVAGLIAGTCVGACAAEPVGAAVCAACVGAIATIGAADIGGVIACFKL